jgi:uncharacterized membrane protein YfcA
MGTWATAVVTGAVLLAAAIVKGVLAFGFPLISVPALATVLGARTAVLVVSIPAFAANLLLMGNVGWQRLERWFAVLIVSLVAGTVTGALLVNRLPVRALALVLGVTALALLGLVGRKLSGLAAGLRRLAPLAGLLAGVLGGATDISGPVLVAYVAGLEHDRERFVFCLTLLYMVIGATQILTFARTGLYTPRLLAWALAACLPMALGTWLGVRLRQRLQSDTFRRAVLVVVALAAANLIRQGLWG